MKALLTLFFLFFSSSVLAEDISDFEIEGMSIGDSLLDYMSEEKILKNQTNYFQHLENTFSMSAFKNLFNSNLYDWIQIGYLADDKKFKIHVIDGVIDYRNNIEDCFDDIKKIKEEISSDFDLNLKDWYFQDNYIESGYY